ncbi:MAG: polysaccharide deacetylase family protein [Treponema sp.]|jgi:peptidoglycan/xylan/chitin deacetylase (PgdA/CDA1 family)|nr:polysaccharide deacetylase family protein [Treponema sp.]
MSSGKKLKIVTFSYDDGVEQDRRLMEILNRYRLKATINLNSGIQSGAGQNKNAFIRRMNIAGLPALYEGHEIAVHSLTHPRLEMLEDETIFNELEQDKLNLERIFGKPVQGMAYPFGTYNDRVIRIAGRIGLRYARGVGDTLSFDIPLNLMAYIPTCHHKNPQLMELAERFVKLKPETPQVFYVWGHSYEFDMDRNWQVLEDFCKFISGRDGIAYCTNAEALL